MRWLYRVTCKRPVAKEGVEKKHNVGFPDIYSGVKVKIKETPHTKSLGIANGEGRVERTEGNDVWVVHEDKYFGGAGPFKLSPEEVEPQNFPKQ